jgi:hypothetical protein
MIAVVAALFLASAPPQPAITSRYTKVTSCRLWAAGDVQAHAYDDWITYRCTGLPGRPTWIHYDEGTHMQMGFGPRPNFSGMFETDRNKDWPIEWRGRVVKGRFVPSAAIVRIRARFDDTGTSDLAVYHLLGNGTSCIFPTSISTNAKARKIADAVPSKDNCYVQPQKAD